MKTRKEQIKAILDEYAIFKGYYVKGGAGAERIYSGELADRIAALPLDVPNDKKLRKMCEYTFDSLFLQMAGMIIGRWMRKEIIKRNRP